MCFSVFSFQIFNAARQLSHIEAAPTGVFKQCILLSLSVKATFDLLDMLTAPDVLQSQCIHTCHTNGLIIRLRLLMNRVNRLFTAQRSVKC